MVSKKKSGLLNAVEHLVESGEYSDLVVKGSEKTYVLHKAIVFPQIEQFKENTNAESILDLTDDDPWALEAVVEYLYETDYNPYFQKSKPGSHSCYDPSRPLVGGFGRPHQICLHHTCSSETCNFSCVDFICENCPSVGIFNCAGPADIDNHTSVYLHASKYHATALQKLAADKLAIACFQFWYTEEFAHAAKVAVTIDDTLCEIVAKVLSEHLELLHQENLGKIFHDYHILVLDFIRIEAGYLEWRRGGTTKYRMQ